MTGVLISNGVSIMDQLSQLKKYSYSIGLLAKNI